MYRDQLTAEEQAALDDANSLLAAGGSSPAAPEGYDAAAVPVSDEAPVETASPAVAAAETSAGESLHNSAAELVSQAREAMSINRRDEARALAQKADSMGAAFAAGEDSPARVLAELDGAPTAPAGRGPMGGDSKQQAEWLLHQARELITMVRYDEAEKKLAEARAMNVRWGLFDDTPAKVAKDLERVRPAKTESGSVEVASHDRKSAKAKLKTAREMIAAGQVDQAEALAVEVGTWGVRYGMFEDNPTKVAAAARAMKRRDLARRGDHAVSKDLYQIQLAEARDLLRNGKLDEAEMKARYAQRMNIVPGLNEDRAEAVLHDVAQAREHGVDPNAANVAAVAEPNATDPAVQRVLDAQGDPSAANPPAVQPEMAGDHSRPAFANDPLAPSPAPAQAQAPVNDPSAPNLASNLYAPLTDTAPTPVEQPEAAPAALELAMVNPDAPAPAPAAEETAPLQLEEPAPAVEEAAPLQLEETAPAPAPVVEEAAPLQVEEPAPVAEQPLAASPLPVEAPVPAYNQAPVIEEQPVPVEQPAANPGEVVLSQARELMVAGNYAAARRRANEAKQSQTGVEAPAEELLAQIGLAEQAGALKLYDAALVAVREQQNDRARALLNEIVASEIQDENIKQKVEDLLVRLPSDNAGRASTRITMEDAETVNAQRLNAEVGAAAAEARSLMETDPDKAIAKLQTTMTAVKAAGLNESATRTMVRRLEVAIELAKKDKAAFDVKMQDKKYRAEIEQKRLRILEADNAKLARVKELFEKSKEAEAAGDLMKAEQLAKQIIEIDPNNVAAVAQATVTRYRRRMARDKEILAEKDEGAVVAFQEVDAAGIADPTAQLRGISMPKDFADLTRARRDLADRLKVKKDPKTLEIERRLREPISVNFDDTPLSEAVDYIAQMTGINVVLDTTALSEEGVAPTTPVKLTLKDAKLSSVLKIMLRQLHLCYTTTDDVLLITNTQSGRERTFTVAYPVTDLVISPIAAAQKNQPQGVPNWNPGAPQGNVAGGAPGDGTALIGSQNGPGDTAPKTDILNTLNGNTSISAPKPDFGPLIDMIKISVAPGTWKEGPESLDGSGNSYGLGAGFAGGVGDDAPEPIGSITPFFLNISLIIRHTSEVHDDIVDLLRQLRRLQDLQVSIEVRFITVSDSFFEQIGVDFDFSIQSDAVGKHSSFAIPNPAAALGSTTNTNTGGGGVNGGQTNTTPPFLINPIRDHAIPGQSPLIVGRAGNGDTGNFTQDLQMPFLQGSANSITPFNALSSNTGATFGISFLSDLEVYLFLTAAQGDVRSNLVQAPKVTTFNGASASVFNYTGRNYVAALIPLVGAGAIGFQPVVQTFPDGVQLFVTPVVSADRRYVRMTLSPQFTTLIQFDTYTSQTGAVGGGGLGGGATSVTTQIQLPVFSITMVSTTVTVPDGGTVLMGGVKRLREERREFGVPILAKTPFIDRLFKNIGIGRTTDSLMLMVTPRIIILEEEEEKLGIPSVQSTF
jgi:type II secretory pathway component GspD/PulD (secretin)